MSLDPIALKHAAHDPRRDLFQAVIAQAYHDAFEGLYLQERVAGLVARERREAVLFLVGGGEWEKHRNFIAELAGEDGDCLRDRTLQAFRTFESIFGSIGALIATAECEKAEATHKTRCAYKTDWQRTQRASMSPVERADYLAARREQKRASRMFRALEQSAAEHFEIDNAA